MLFLWGGVRYRLRQDHIWYYIAICRSHSLLLLWKATPEWQWLEIHRTFLIKVQWCQPQRATESDKHHLSKKTRKCEREQVLWHLSEALCSSHKSTSTSPPVHTLFPAAGRPTFRTNQFKNMQPLPWCRGAPPCRNTFLSLLLVQWEVTMKPSQVSTVFNKPPCLEPLWLSDACDKQCFHWKRDVTNCKDGLISLYRECEWMEEQTEDSGLFACFAATIKPGALWQGSCMHY